MVRTELGKYKKTLPRYSKTNVINTLNIRRLAAIVLCRANNCASK